MATGTAAEILSRIEDLMFSAEARDIAYQEATQAALDAIASNIVIVRGALVNESETALEVLIGIRTRLDQTNNQLDLANVELTNIFNAIDGLNANNAVNAKTDIALMTGSAGVCCDTLPVVTILPERLCARAQRIWDWIGITADSLCALADESNPPTVEQLRDILRNDAWHSAANPMFTDSELVTIQGAIITRGFGGLTALCNLEDNTAVKDRFIELIYNSTTAQEAATKLAAELFNDLGVSDPWDKFIRFLFPLSLMNLLYNDEIEIGDDAYDNTICGDPPITPPCTTFDINRSLLGGYGGGSDQPEIMELTEIEPIWLEGYWLRLVVQRDDFDEAVNAELWRTDTFPDEKVADLLNSVPYDFMKPASVALSQFEVRWTNYVPEGWDTEVLMYNNLGACRYWADGATSPIEA